MDQVCIYIIFILFLDSVNPNKVPRAATNEEAADYYVNTFLKNKNPELNDFQAMAFYPTNAEANQLNKTIREILEPDRLNRVLIKAEEKEIDQ